MCESKKLEMLHLHCKTSSGSTWKEKNDGLLNDVKTDIGSKNSYCQTFPLLWPASIPNTHHS